MTTIEWTDETLNVVVGCDKISPGCKNCYAVKLAATRLRNEPKYKGLAVRKGDHYEWTGKAHIWKKTLNKVFDWRKPRKIFLTSMGDPFHTSISNKELELMFGVMALNQQHTFQVLTKRPERMREFMRSRTAHQCLDTLSDPEFDGIGEDNKLKLEPIDSAKLVLWPPPNVWLGVSVENQQCANERIPLLLKTPAAVRFLSCEPLLEDVNLEQAICEMTINASGESEPLGVRPKDEGIHWVIVGGESGDKARPFNLQWARNIVHQCQEGDVAVFVKQLGDNPHDNGVALDFGSKGKEFGDWPKELQVREFPR